MHYSCTNSSTLVIKTVLYLLSHHIKFATCSLYNNILVKSTNQFLQCRQHIFNKIQTITTLVEQCTDKQTLQTINTQLGTTIGLIKCYLEQTKPVLPPKRQHEPVNKTIAPQRPFFSTRKRQKTPSIRLAKPKNTEKEEIEKKLNNDTRLYMAKKSTYGMSKSNIKK